jgi:hypothetical protein
MDISSSDDNESGEKTARVPTKVDGEEDRAVVPKQNGENANVNNSHLSEPIDAHTLSDSNSLNSRQSTKQRRKQHCDDCQDDCDYNNEWEWKTRKERHRQHVSGGQSDTEESREHASDNNLGMKNKRRQKKNHWSRSQHGKC